MAVVWPIVGTAVVLAITVAAAGGVEPSEAELATGAVCVLAVVYAVHAWRRLWADERRRS
jgi:hypothetical protein